MVVYLTTHIPTGKKYIGKDLNNSKTYFGSGTEIKKIIKQEGKSNFKKEILEYCSTKEELSQKEEYWLNFFKAETNPSFLNKTNKAFGNSGHTKDSKTKIKKSLQSRKWDIAWNKKISEGRKGVKPKKYKTREDKGKLRGKNIRLSQWAKTRDRSYLNKPVLQFGKKGNFIKEYSSKKEAENFNNVKLQNVLTNLAKTCKGYVWKYKE
jgi:hypothetical protein